MGPQTPFLGEQAVEAFRASQSCWWPPHFSGTLEFFSARRREEASLQASGVEGSRNSRPLGLHSGNLINLLI